MTNKITAAREITPHMRKALAILAGSPNGTTESMMVAHGFSQALLVDLVTAGLAHAEERQLAKPRTNIVILTITDRGRALLKRRK